MDQPPETYRPRFGDLVMANIGGLGGDYDALVAEEPRGGLVTVFLANGLLAVASVSDLTPRLLQGNPLSVSNFAEIMRSSFRGMSLANSERVFDANV